MTAYSQNGYVANRSSLIGSYLIPGTSTTLTMRKGDVATVLCYVASQFDATVEDIDTPSSKGYVKDHLAVAGSDPSKIRDDWGFAVRPIRGQTTGYSNHASGTAIDLNATQHPRGVHGTFTAEQIKAIRKILAYCDGVVRWGGDYSAATPTDPMHFEINASPAKVAKLARKIKGAGILTKRTKAAAALAAIALAAYIAAHGHAPGKPTPKPKPVATSTPTASPTAKPTPKPTPTKTPVKPTPYKLTRTLEYRPGHKLQTGADVRKVQALVHAHVDGDYGPGAAKHVKAWQKAHGLKADGAFGHASAKVAAWTFK
jgi:peptidoglycan hydrolase-like protein with peptidoglycan-binding domain